MVFTCFYRNDVGISDFYLPVLKRTFPSFSIRLLVFPLQLLASTMLEILLILLNK